MDDRNCISGIRVEAHGEKVLIQGAFNFHRISLEWLLNWYISSIFLLRISIERLRSFLCLFLKHEMEIYFRKKGFQKIITILSVFIWIYINNLLSFYNMWTAGGTVRINGKDYTSNIQEKPFLSRHLYVKQATSLFKMIRGFGFRILYGFRRVSISVDPFYDNKVKYLKTFSGLWPGVFAPLVCCITSCYWFWNLLVAVFLLLLIVNVNKLQCDKFSFSLLQRINLKF